MQYDGKQLVIIAMTAGVYAQRKRRMFSRRYGDYVIKPIDFNKFYDTFEFWKRKLGKTNASN